MIEALVLVGVMFLTTWVVCTMDDSEPGDWWNENE